MERHEDRRLLMPLRELFAFAGVCLALASPAPAQASGPDEAAAPDTVRHAAWSALLEEYVAPGPNGVNRFDYAALKADSDDRAALERYIAGYESLDFDTLDRDAAFAAWANLYNAVTVRHILERYPLGSIRDGYLFGGPWKDVTVIADGGEISLDAIEHDVLRVEWDDPRVHYAVNCASIGCPDLLNRAWTGETLDTDLDAAARAYVNHPRGVTVRENGTLKVSRIYKWFREDFGGSDDGVIAHLRQYADADLRPALAGDVRIRGHQYDWSLNDVEG